MDVMHRSPRSPSPPLPILSAGHSKKYVVFDLPPHSPLRARELPFSSTTTRFVFLTPPAGVIKKCHVRERNEIRRSHKRDADGSTYPASAKSASGSRFKFTPRSWKKSSSAPIRGGAPPAGFAATATAAAAGDAAAEGDSGSDSDDTDGLDDSDTDDDDVEEEEEHADTDDDEDEEQEEFEESDRRSSADAGSARAVATRAEYGRSNDNDNDNDGRVMWVLKSGEEAKLEGMDMTRNLRLRVGFAPADGSSSCRFVSWPRASERGA